ncbi:signal peptidase I [Sphingobacterium sp. Mn56C]|uniref:signal peptidase I n=1 Tax=Sphingobacterium sp. Mn56C TaxID=3395261 RepID=UPI003BC0D37E
MWYLIFAVLTAVSLYGLWLLFKKAGKQGWEAIVPVYREYVLAQLVGSPTWWIVWLFVPIVNVFIFYGFYLDFIKSFGKRRFWENAAAVLVPFIVLPLWGRDAHVKYLGQTNTEAFKKKYPYKKTVAREWADAIIFATIAASLIRGFLIEAYMIPSGSMERTLLVGDFLFVSKLNYGPRIPNTPIAFPFAHHTMPITGGKAYSEWIELPYKRLPGFQQIKRNDVVVFNYPVEADAPFNRPVDKRENYIKRAVAIPGDVVEMHQGILMVNGKPGFGSNDVQSAYYVYTDERGLDLNILKDKRFEYNLVQDQNGNVAAYLLLVTKDEIEEVKRWSNVKQVVPYANESPAFPKDSQYNWDFHNFGPITIPKKGDTVPLNALTLPLYHRLITVYEGHKLENRADGIYIDDAKADSYKIQMDYYWMMGDNRDNSLDSRDFGFVPEDHVVGKALFTWLSYDTDGTFLSKIRWNRIFKGIN